MQLTIKLFIGVLLLPIHLSFAQEIASIEYLSKTVIPYNQKLGETIIGGISGIAFNSADSLYYLVADKPPSRLFKVSISNGDSPAISFLERMTLAPEPLKKSELEGIVYNPATKGYFVADEQKEGTRIIELNNNTELKRIFEPINAPFLPLSGHNSGIEGLTISTDLNQIYYAFERPTLDCHAKGLVEIRRKGVNATKADGAYYYKLHTVNGDILKTNGISEIIYLDEKSLLIMERAYIPGIGNIVRLFNAFVEDDSLFAIGNACGDDMIKPIKSKLLFDFVSVPEVQIDNAEGMAFNADRSKLYLVTDNNFSKKQETQIIALTVIWQ